MEAYLRRSWKSSRRPVTPSNIAKDGDERACYEDILFANAGVDRPEDIDRRRSLMLLLAVTKQRGAAPGIFDVRWMLYAGYDPDNRALQLSGDDLVAQRWHWWVYQANDLLHVCYEALLKFALDILSEYPAGVSLSRLIGESAARLLSARDDEAADWKSFLAAHPVPANCLLPGASQYRGECPVSVQDLAEALGRARCSKCQVSLES